MDDGGNAGGRVGSRSRSSGSSPGAVGSGRDVDGGARYPTEQRPEQQRQQQFPYDNDQPQSSYRQSPPAMSMSGTSSRQWQTDEGDRRRRGGDERQPAQLRDQYIDSIMTRSLYADLREREQQREREVQLQQQELYQRERARWGGDNSYQLMRQQQQQQQQQESYQRPLQMSPRVSFSYPSETQQQQQERPPSRRPSSHQQQSSYMDFETSQSQQQQQQPQQRPYPQYPSSSSYDDQTHHRDSLSQLHKRHHGGDGQFDSNARDRDMEVDRNNSNGGGGGGRDDGWFGRTRDESQQQQRHGRDYYQKGYGNDEREREYASTVPIPSPSKQQQQPEGKFIGERFTDGWRTMTFSTPSFGGGSGGGSVAADRSGSGSIAAGTKRLYDDSGGSVSASTSGNGRGDSRGGNSSWMGDERRRSSGGSGGWDNEESDSAVMAKRRSLVATVMAKGKKNRYCLLVRQQPERCRACGFGSERSNRRPIDPSIVVQLAVVTPSGELDASLGTLGDVTSFVAHAVLLSSDGREDRSIVVVPSVVVPNDLVGYIGEVGGGDDDEDEVVEEGVAVRNRGGDMEGGLRGPLRKGEWMEEHHGFGDGVGEDVSEIVVGRRLRGGNMNIGNHDADGVGGVLGMMNANSLGGVGHMGGGWMMGKGGSVGGDGGHSGGSHHRHHHHGHHGIGGGGAGHPYHREFGGAPNVDMARRQPWGMDHNEHDTHARAAPFGYGLPTSSSSNPYQSRPSPPLQSPSISTQPHHHHHHQHPPSISTTAQPAGTILPIPATAEALATPPGSGEKWESTLFGSIVSSCHFLTDLTGQKGAYFVFPDLSVRVEGTYRLKIVLSHLGAVVEAAAMAFAEERSRRTVRGFPGGGSSGAEEGGLGFGVPAPVIATTITEPFVSFGGRDWIGMQESSELSKHFADQGIKIPIRRKARKATRGAAGGVVDDMD
ncbi:hypothetical protein HDU76_007445 [Blyttiomyces sp. JEL0837]|nr:hypothetical protein HDU76_007445 [Blyttiomyces sp. JEL0837]